MGELFTCEKLGKFNGANGSSIYISVKGVVYDCSAGSDFYGPGAAYNVFAGKDVTRCLAKMIIDDVEANAGWDNLAEEHMETLEEWIEKFRSKYPVVGCFAPDPDFDKRGIEFEP